MGKYNYITIDSVVEDWLDFSGEDQQELDESVIKKWANDAIERFTTGEQLVHNIDYAPLRDYKLALPRGFRYLTQVAYKPTDHRVKRHIVKSQIIDTTLSMLDNMARVVPNCKRENCDVLDCNCHNSVLRIDLENIYDVANKGLFKRYLNHFSHRGTRARTTNSGQASCYHPGFRIMRKTSNDFFNIPYHIDESVNFNADCEVEYNITKGANGQIMLVSNLKECEVLISYLGTQLDSNGYRMIPDVEIAFKAVNLYIEERIAYRVYRRSREQKDRLFYENLKVETERIIARVKSQISSPDPDEWKQWVRNNWLKLVPAYDSQRQFGRRTDDEFGYPRQTSGLISHRHPAHRGRGGRRGNYRRY